MEEYKLAEGSEIKLSTIGKKDALIEHRGVFKGYVSLAGTPALLLDTEEGKKIVSAHMIVTITVLKEEDKKKEKTPENLYG